MTSPIQSHLKKGEELGPQIRLLICYECKTIDELPDYEGDPAGDVLLQVQIERNHVEAGTGREHVGRLGKVPVKYWSDPKVKAEIIQQINHGAPGLAGVDQEFYDSRNNFYEDALACYEKHLRPKGRCPDWRADNKRLLPNTQADRREAGITTKVSETGPRVYLCQFCPANVFMITKARAEAGMYK